MRGQDGTLADESLQQLPRRRSRLIVLFVLIAVAAAFWGAVYHEDRKQRVQFLEHARLVSRAIDWIDIQELSASEADLASPAYRRIKAQLIGIQNTVPKNRFVYLLKQRPDGVIVILADSEPPSSKEYSPPGQVYRETSATIRQVFASGREATLGPYSDRRGHRVSAIAPVSDPEICRTVALLGMDIVAHVWYRELALKTAESLALIMVFVVPLAVYVMQRRRSEQSLRLSRNEWQNTFDCMPDLIVILDTEHRIVRANRAMRQVLEQDGDSIIGQHCYRHVHKQDAPPDFCPHAKLLKDGASHAGEAHLSGLGGDYSITVTPLHDADGNLTGSIHNAHDITLRKRAEQDLHDSEERYRMLFNEALVGICMADAETGIITDCNQTMANLTGRQIDNLIGAHQTSLHPPHKCNDSYSVTFMQHRKEAAGNVLPDQLITSSGEIRDVEIKARTFVFRDKLVMLGTFNDITERKRIEEELRQKTAEVEQFIYTVSHDLRSPLVTVKTFLGYLGQDISTGDNDRIVKDMEFMHTAADRMEALLNELLDIARVGRTTTPLEPVSFQELSTEALDAVAGQIATGKVDVRVSAANPTLYGDRRRLLQIWQNLLDNALKYMGDQVSPCIEIGVEQQQQGKTVFIVSDNGIGIAPEYHEKVFGIFEKLDREIGGVGMGLTMVKRVVETYGGHIRVVSEGNGTGSCFRFTLPGAVGVGGAMNSDPSTIY